jgi:uncharacterized DUF497 family protein
VEFEWNARKAARNLVKHGVSFEEASTVFGDPLAGTILDPRQFADEPRFVTIGLSTGQHLIVVAHADSDDTIRIISARRATRSERRRYEATSKD